MNPLYKLIILFVVFGATTFSLSSQNVNRENFVGPYGLQVNTFTGNLFYSRTDFSIPSAGPPIDISFSYNSYDFANPGGGWSFPYQMYCKVNNNLDSIIVVRNNGREDLFVKNAQGDYIPPVGVFDELVTKSSGFIIELTTKDGMIYEFQETINYNLLKIEDSNGNNLFITSFSTLVDTEGRTVSLNYQNGQLVEIEDASSSPTRSFFYSYNAEGRLIQVTDPLGYEASYAYNEQGLLSRMIDPNGNPVDILYTEGGAVKRINACLSTISFQYDTDNNKTYVTKENGTGEQITVYTYNDQGQLINKKGSCCGLNISYVYDNDGNITQAIDANGNSTTFSYDDNGNLVESVNALSHQEMFAYQDAFNKVIGTTDAKGNERILAYDDNGNLESVMEPLGVVQNYTYDDNGNLTSIEDGEGNVTSMSYDNDNNLELIEYPIGSESFEYDNRGNVLKFENSVGNMLYFEYDELDQLVEVRDALNHSFFYEYDGVGNLTKETDPKNIERNYGYDAEYRLTFVETPSGTTLYTYDHVGNLVEILDANQHQSRFQYDDRNFLVQEEDALGNSSTYNYDNKGNLTARTDPNGQNSNFSYDAIDRLLEKTYSGNTDKYVYDENDNLIACSNKHISMTFSYDELDRLIEQNILNWGKTISYTYDKAGNRKTMTDSDNGITSYEYDANNRLIQITNPNNEVTTFTYDDADRLIRQDNANGTYSTYDYDVGDRLLAMGNFKSNGDTISHFAYTYDANGNRLTRTELGVGTSVYTYDDDNQLKTVSYPDGTTEEYFYDAVGNRTQLIRNGGATNYVFDAADRLQSAGSTTYEFDANGNMIKKTDASGTYLYTYDGEDRLVEVVTPSGDLVEYAYGPLGNRISKTVNGVEKRFIYDGSNILSELDAQGNSEAFYTSALNLDSWISMERNGSSYFYHKDALGSVYELTNNAADVAASYEYDVFGNITAQSGSVNNPLRFTGREWEQELNYYFHRSRYYDPEVGRFTSEDKYGGELQDPQSLNKYIYVINNPTGFTDPDGEIWQFIATAIAGVAEGVSVANTAHKAAKVFKWGYSLIKKGWGLGKRYSKQAVAGISKVVKYISTKGKKGVDYVRRKVGEVNNFIKKQYRKLPEPIKRKINKYKKGASIATGLNFLVAAYKKGILCVDIADVFIDGFIFPADLSKANEILAEVTGSPSGTSPKELGVWIFKYNLKKRYDLKLFDCENEEGKQGPRMNKNLEGECIIIEISILRAIDPNDITGPLGFGDSKWVAVDDRLPYRIRFENDPDFATAPAQKVYISFPIPEHIRATSLRIDDFGFGPFTFEVPDGQSTYTQRLDVRDSLGVFVDVTAGLDPVKNEAFWVFQSIDPATNLPTTLAPDAGFLPVNDTLTGSGEGFVTFSIVPESNTETGDSINAQAAIVFDINAPIETNIETNIIDAFPPESSVDNFQVAADTSQVVLSWSGADDTGGSGIATYDLYVSENGAPFMLYQAGLDTNALAYAVTPGGIYSFFTLATDNVGNREALKAVGDVVVDLTGGVSQCSYTQPNVFLTGQLSPGLYRAQNSITLSNLTVFAGDETEVTAGSTITILPGVTVQNGSDFHAFIQDCEPPAMQSPAKENTDDTSKNETESKILALKCFPNPFQASTTIQFVLPVPGAVELYVVDMTGKVINPIHSGEELNKGIHYREISGEAIKPGFYLVVLQSKGQRVVEKLLKLN